MPRTCMLQRTVDLLVAKAVGAIRVKVLKRVLHVGQKLVQLAKLDEGEATGAVAVVDPASREAMAPAVSGVHSAGAGAASCHAGGAVGVVVGGWTRAPYDVRNSSQAEVEAALGQDALQLHGCDVAPLVDVDGIKPASPRWRLLHMP
jgi:hypothetical protein